MDNFFNEIINICKLPFEEVSNDYKVLLIAGKSIYISNYKKIIDYSDSKVILKIKNNTLEIIGENMEIVQINKGEILINGKIFSFGLGVKSEKK